MRILKRILREARYLFLSPAIILYLLNSVVKDRAGFLATCILMFAVFDLVLISGNQLHKSRFLTSRLALSALVTSVVLLVVYGPGLQHTSTSLILPMLTVYPLSVIVWILEKIGQKITRANTQRRLNAEKAQREEYKKREELLNSLVGDDVLVRGFLLALERLTRYVPDMATTLLDAVTSDIREYQILLASIGSTQNAVLCERQKRKACDIKNAARELCARLTEEALETIHIHESMEADNVPGVDERPRMEQAGAVFQHYLDGLREAGQVSSTPSLAREIDSLEAKQEMEVVTLPLAPVERRRIAGKGRLHTEN